MERSNKKPRGAVKLNSVRYQPYKKEAPGATPPVSPNQNDVDTAWLFLDFIQQIQVANPRKSISQVMDEAIEEWVVSDMDARKSFIDGMKKYQKYKLCKKREQRKKRKLAKVKAPALKKKKCIWSKKPPRKIQDDKDKGCCTCPSWPFLYGDPYD